MTYLKFKFKCSTILAIEDPVIKTAGLVSH